MSRQEGQLLGHHMQMGGQQMGGMPMQWPGGGVYYGAPMAFMSLGYGYQPMMTQQQQPAQQKMPFMAHRPAGGYNLNGHLASEHGLHEG